jgi:hypothetical protein
MNTVTPAVLETFAVDLVRRGLPVEYAERAGTELADHHGDLAAELLASGLDEVAASHEAARRLGPQRMLVEKTVREFQRRHWCGRWPFSTFLLGPIGLVVLSWVAIVLLAHCIFLPLEQMGLRLDQNPDGIISRSEYVGEAVAHVLFLFVGPAISLMILARFARKAAMGPAWLCLSTSILTVFASSIWCGFASSARANAPADLHLLMFGLPMFKFANDPMYIAQCLLPFGIGIGFLFRMRQQSCRAERLMLELDMQGGKHEQRHARSA